MHDILCLPSFWGRQMDTADIPEAPSASQILYDICSISAFLLSSMSYMNYRIQP